MTRSRVLDAVTFGPARRRRWMRKRLAELTRLDALDSTPDRWRTGASPQARRPPRRPASRHRSGIITIAIAMVVVAVSAGYGQSDMNAASSAWSRLSGLLQSAGVPQDVVSAAAPVVGQARPPAGVESQQRRLLPSVPAPVPAGAYETFDVAGTTARYDPCRPIHYVVRSHGESAAYRDAVRRAVADASAATGLVFVDDGATDENPSEEREAYQPARYPSRWAPLLIAFTDPSETPALEGDPIGDGGSASVSNRPQTHVYVTGQIRLDLPQLRDDLGGDLPDLVAQVTRHELGHVLGLDHTDDDTQLMHPSSPKASTYQAGDLTGLAFAGAGPCVPGI